MLRLTPVDRPGQHVHAAALDIDPPPIGRREGADFFGNHMTWIALNEPHDRLVVKVAARVAVEAPTSRIRSATLPWEDLRDDGVHDHRLRVDVARAFPISEPAGARSIRKFATMRAQAFRPAVRCSTARSN